MKTGTDLQVLAKEIQRRAESKKDFVAPVQKLWLTSGAPSGPDAEIPLLGVGEEAFPLTELAHEQLADYVDIPRQYYRRLQVAQPDLLAANVNRWLPHIEKKGKPDRRLIRTLDGRVRALLSGSYRTLENEDLAEAVLPVLQDEGLIIVSAALTDTRFYIKAVDPRITRDVPTGRRLGDGSHVFFDTVSPAITIRNSEVGLGLLAVETSVWTKVCTNLATFGSCLRKYHTGARAEVSDEVYALLTDDTKRKTDAAIWAQTRDIVKASFDIARFDALCHTIGDAAQQKINDDPVEVISRVGKRYGFSEKEKTGVLQHLIQGGDLSQYGLHAAVTRTAEDISDYDRASEFEKYGGNIIELPRRDWEEITKVAA